MPKKGTGSYKPYEGKLADPEWRKERARKAGKVSASLDTYIGAVVRRAGKLTPEQVERLRAILPEPASGKPSVDGGRNAS